MRLEPLISHSGILMTFYLSIILDLQNFLHWYILQSWKLKRPPIQLRPHHFWTYTSNLTTVVNSVLKNSDSYEYGNKSARREAKFVPIGMPTTCWNSIPRKETNMLSMGNSSILIASFSVGRRHTNGYEFCLSSSRFISILIWVGVSWKACKR
jgi:hypothetical protein